MKKLAAIFKNKEIRGRILFTLGIFLIFRIGSAITVPGVSLGEDTFQDGNILGLLNLMGGGALQSFSVFALGVSPYITSSIIIELLSMDVLPKLTELSKEGQSGRKKIEMTTRYLTLFLGAVQAYGITVTMQNSQGLTMLDPSPWGYIKICVYLVAGAMLVMWLGDQITQKGLGNGISMIIFCGIVSALPNQIYSAFQNYLMTKINSGNATLILEGVAQLIIYLLAFVAIIIFVTFIEKSIRKLPVSHSGMSQSMNSKSAQSNYLPIKINSSGVIPVIFAGSLMMAPAVISGFLSTGGTTPGWVTTMLAVFNSSALVEMPWFGDAVWYMPWGLIIYIFLTVVFCFFYSNLQINPERMATDFQTNGTYITGLRPGAETRSYIKKVLNRVTCIGALSLAFIAALPIVLALCKIVPQSLALGGTGLIIIVGVALEVNNQIDGLLAGKDYSRIV